MKRAPLAAVFISMFFPVGFASAAESANIELQLRKLSDKIATSYKGLFPKEWRYQRFAVIKFTESGESAKKKELGTVVSSQLAVFLHRDQGFALVEREKLNKVIDELALQQTGVIKVEDTKKAGELLDAQALVLGEVSEAGDKYLVNARIVSADKGNALVTDSVQVQALGLVALASDAVELRTVEGAVYRGIFPGWGQFYNRQPIKAWGFIGAEAVVLGAALGFHLDGMSNEDKYKGVACGGGCSNEEAKKVSDRAAFLHDEAEKDYRMRNYFLFGAAAVWAYGLFDAYMNAVDFEKQVNTGATGALINADPTRVGFALRF